MFTGLIPILYNLYYAKDNYKTFFFFTELLGLKKWKKKKNGDPSGKLCDSIHSQAVDKVLSSCHLLHFDSNFHHGCC